MKISLKTWAVFILIAVLSLAFWFNFKYSQFTFIDLSIGKKEALTRAQSYLRSIGVDEAAYSKAIVFHVDYWADRYLQKTLGLEELDQFNRQHNHQLFSWKIRFFKELEKEEYVIKISPSTAEILSFDHLIDDVEPRESISKESARRLAEEFLKSSHGLDLEYYQFNEEKTKRYDHRIDYYFSWEKKDIYIPWQEREGGAKLLIGATVSGREIREFYKTRLEIPEKFKRFIENQMVFGEYLSSFSFILFIVFLVWSIFFVVSRSFHLTIRLCKKWYIYLGIFFVIVSFAFIFNNLENLKIGFSTSSPLLIVVGLYLVRASINIIFFSLAVVMPALAGESLRNEVMMNKKYASFLHYIKSSFCNRSMAQSIVLGYLFFFIFLGLQAALFALGHKYLGVWRDSIRFTQFSSSYIPLLAAFVIGVRASLREEVIYRLFGITLAKKYFKSTALAIIFPALVWGFGHSTYAIFPVWFRGIEVTIIGLLFGLLFIKYGIVPLIVAHYLFDVFWDTAAYIFGNAPLGLFVGSIVILLLPLVFAAVSYYLNKQEKERELRMLLSATQRYNLDILLTFLANKKSQGLNDQAAREELLSHNWDVSLVDLAIKQVYNKVGRIR